MCRCLRIIRTGLRARSSLSHALMRLLFSDSAVADGVPAPATIRASLGVASLQARPAASISAALMIMTIVEAGQVEQLAALIQVTYGELPLKRHGDMKFSRGLRAALQRLPGLGAGHRRTKGS